MALTAASLFSLNPGLKTNESSSVNKAGTVSDMVHGDGTFAKTLETINGQKTVDKTVSYADGTQKSVERVITLNDDGSKTILKTRNGKTTTIQETSVKNDDGTISLTKDITTADGRIKELTGTITKTDGETDKTFTATSATGQTETMTHTITRDGNVATHVRSGTGYDGKQVYDESTWTTFA